MSLNMREQQPVANKLTTTTNSESTFKYPPLDHTLSVPGLYEYHAKNSPDHPAFTYASVTGVPRDIPYAEVWARIGVVAKLISEHQPRLPDSGTLEGAGSCPVIGIVALSDTLSYIYTMIAIMSLGFTVFPMSAANDARAIAHLAKIAGVNQLFVSEDEETQTLIHDAVGMLREHDIQVDLVRMIKYSDTEPTSGQESFVGVVDSVADDEVMMFLHSSGTTGMPKAIPITQKGLRESSNTARLGEIDLLGKRFGMHTNPPFHGLGLRAITAPVSTGAIMAFYPPTSPPTVPTPANFLQAWTACQCDIIICIPPLIEALAKNPANIPALKALEYVVFSGISMKKATGDMLSATGVRLCSLYGSTEAGSVSVVLPANVPVGNSSEWEYFEFAPFIACTMIPIEGHEGAFDVVMTASEAVTPYAFNTVLDGKPALSFGDVLERHPTDPKRWKVLGRTGSQIRLSAGENVNPVPIEEALIQDPHIRCAIVFGHQQLELGVLVEVAPGLEIPPADMEALARFKQIIWPTIEKINKTAASYAKIRPEMIIVTSPHKPLEYTAKRTARRGVCLALYSKEIADLYTNVEASAAPEEREFRLRM
ncbi:acetyl-CoA synthetase-like protein [Cubamyces lactineus]|nr:acetyl-CoA synthetase-like protein [Cubamyces lactineus]